MKFAKINIWKLTILVSLFASNSSANELDTIRVENYKEIISIDSSGKLSSQISIILDQNHQNIELPLLRSDSFKIITNSYLKTDVIGSENNKYLRISANDNKPLTNDIKLEVLYAGTFSEASFWNFFKKPKLELAYSNPKGQMLEADKLKIQLELASNYSFEMADDLKNHFSQSEIDLLSDENRLIVQGENKCLQKTNLGVIVQNKSYSYFTHLLFIMLLIGIYYTFLKYLVNN